MITILYTHTRIPIHCLIHALELIKLNKKFLEIRKKKKKSPYVNIVTHMQHYFTVNDSMNLVFHDRVPQMYHFRFLMKYSSSIFLSFVY